MTSKNIRISTPRFFYERGELVAVETTFEKASAFGSPAYYNPTTYKIDITDPDGTKVVNNQDLVNSATGKYYYYWQSNTTSIKGVYDVAVRTFDGTYNDNVAREDVFVIN
ncbi:MAG: hypothetical protein QMD05_10420 [Candidatus Brocadiaceae bacterium]|nr:hypothetical protein [Candidatus Brocadiaceae bacterium]